MISKYLNQQQNDSDLMAPNGSWAAGEPWPPPYPKPVVPMNGSDKCKIFK